MRLALIFVSAALAAPLAAQTAPAPAATSPAATPRLTLDTPIEAIMADPEAKKVLDASLPGVADHPMYARFKSLSLSAIAEFAPDRLPADRLTQIREALAAIK